jgi:uncharacterized protein (DUF2384 family)
MALARSSSDRAWESITHDPATNWRAVHILTRVDAMGILGEKRPRTFSAEAFHQALVALAAAGIARTEVQSLEAGHSGREALRRIDDALEASPLPDSEWPAMTAVLGDDLLTRLVHSSLSSAGRYRRGERLTPDLVAARLHFVTLIVADLAGAYNDRGIRRWFSRPRPQLDRKTPESLLDYEWDVDDVDPCRVAALAGALVGPGNAT